MTGLKQIMKEKWDEEFARMWDPDQESYQEFKRGRGHLLYKKRLAKQREDMLEARRREKSDRKKRVYANAISIKYDSRPRYMGERGSILIDSKSKDSLYKAIDNRWYEYQFKKFGSKHPPTIAAVLGIKEHN